MAAIYNPELDTLEFKVEAALKKYLLSANVPAAQIYTGEEIDYKILPAIVCKCHGGPENPPGSNNFLVDVEVCIVSNADLTEGDADPFPPHRRLAAQVNWLLWKSMLDTNGIEYLHVVLSAQVPYLVVQNEIQFEDRQIGIRDRKITTEFRFKMQCYEGLNGVTGY
jgi:hypothetical protein